jgi:hypothetical protein
MGEKLRVRKLSEKLRVHKLGEKLQDGREIARPQDGGDTACGMGEKLRLGQVVEIRKSPRHGTVIVSPLLLTHQGCVAVPHTS